MNRFSTIANRGGLTCCLFQIAAAWPSTVFLRGDFADGRPQMLEMRRSGVTSWEATVWLRPGEYRYRYYLGQGETLIVHTPEGHDVVGGLDGIVAVPVTDVNAVRTATVSAVPTPTDNDRLPINGKSERNRISLS